MYLLDKISSAWTAVNNLGTGNEKDPLKDHYPSGSLERKLVRVKRDANDANDDANNVDNPNNDTVAAREQILTQYRCQDGVFKVAYGPDVKTNGVDDLICPNEEPNDPVLCKNPNQVLCKNPNITVPQVTFFPYEETMSPEEGCYYTPAVARATAKYMQEVVCPKIPNAKTGICFANDPNPNRDDIAAIVAGSVPIALGGFAIVAVVVQQIGSLCYRFWGKKEAQEVPVVSVSQQVPSPVPILEISTSPKSPRAIGYGAVNTTETQTVV